ncbi:MAG TPA: hypothetical protein VHX38_06620 [Pseudonocardiaceae bacterium]|jgi:hypothetical protein|nr:hypothetical protein [Pseudonocardiaceae bacterium]
MIDYLHVECMHNDYDVGMAMTIQIRDVDDEDYTILRTRASMEGLSLTAYLKRELHRLASSPSMAEWVEQVTDREWGVSSEVIARTIRELHDEHDEEAP